MILRYFLHFSCAFGCSLRSRQGCLVSYSSYCKVMQCETSCRRSIVQCENSSDWTLPQKVVQCENSSDWTLPQKVVQCENSSDWTLPQKVVQCENSSDWTLPQIVVQCENSSDWTLPQIVVQCENSSDWTLPQIVMQCENSSDWTLPQIVVQCENSSDPMTLKIVQCELGIKACTHRDEFCAWYSPKFNASWLNKGRQCECAHRREKRHA